MATLDDLNLVLESIDRNITSQGLYLANLDTINTSIENLSTVSQRNSEEQRRSSERSRVDRSVVGSGRPGSLLGGAGSLLGGAGALAGGVGALAGGAGALATGLGRGVGFAGAGIGAALLGLSTVIDQIPNAEEIKKNVETLLTIGEGYESRLDFFLEGGALSLMLGGLGTALVLFAVGSGANAGVQAAVEKFGMQEWPETIKKNVLTLLSIADEVPMGSIGVLASGGSLTVALTGLGVGLATFSTGTGVSAAIDYFSSNSNFAENIKKNVNTLLSIADDKTFGSLQVLMEGGSVSAALVGLGVGIAAFSTLQGISSAIDYFTADDWAEKIKKNVETLLSISSIEILGDPGKFILTMTGIASGLTIFALGKAPGILIDGMDSALSYFTGDDNFAQRIYDQVETLLKIPSIEGAGYDTTKFVATMAGIGLGLSAFALGKGIEGVGEGIQQALSIFTEDNNFAQRIYDQVEKLIQITDLLDGQEGVTKASRFASGMTRIAGGLVAFTAADFVGQLASIGQEILSFFGVESPFEKIMEVANRSEKLERGASALEKIALALGTFSSIDTGNMDVDFEELAKNLGEAIPLFYHLANGGVYDPFGFGNKIDFGPEIPGRGGILNPNLKLEEVANQIIMVRQALSGVLREGSIQGISAINNAGSNTANQTPIIINAPNNSQTNVNARGGSTSTVVNSFGSGRSDIDILSMPYGP